MEFDLEHVRKNFESLSDDALLEIPRDDLVEMAQLLYDAELSRRGLTPRAPEPALDPEVVSDHEEAHAARLEGYDELVPIEGFYTYGQEAMLAKSALESAGIPCMIDGEQAGRLHPGFQSIARGMFLLVPEEFAEEARQVLHHAEEAGRTETLSALNEMETPQPIDRSGVERGFTRLTDEALLEIRRGDLVPVAREIYDAELSRRRLTPREEEIVDAEPEGMDAVSAELAGYENLVTLDTFFETEQALVAKSVLGGHGIPSMLTYENSWSNLMITAAFSRGLHLVIPAEFLDHARELLKQLREEGGRSELDPPY